MVSIGEKFRFLEDGIDFPFYNDIPKLSTPEWLLLLAPVLVMIYILLASDFKSDYLPFIFGLITIIPALYVCKGNYGLLFKKPKAMDFVTIILCLIGYFAYGVLVAAILSHVLGYPVTGDAIVAKYQDPTLFLVISDFFQLMGEELFKVFILLMVMYAVYRFTQNRGLAITLAIIVTLFVFGIAHSRAYSGRLLQILLIQGLGSIFGLYAYMKTKNVMVSYILHLLIDFIPLTVLTLGSMA